MHCAPNIRFRFIWCLKTLIPMWSDFGQLKNKIRRKLSGGCSLFLSLLQEKCTGWNHALEFGARSPGGQEAGSAGGGAVAPGGQGRVASSAPAGDEGNGPQQVLGDSRGQLSCSSSFLPLADRAAVWGTPQQEGICVPTRRLTRSLSMPCGRSAATWAVGLFVELRALLQVSLERLSLPPVALSRFDIWSNDSMTQVDSHQRPRKCFCAG